MPASKHDEANNETLKYPAVEMHGSDLNTAVDIRAGAHSDYGEPSAEASGQVL